MKPYRIFVIFLIFILIAFSFGSFYFSFFEKIPLLHRSILFIGGCGGLILLYYNFQEYINYTELKYDFFIDKFIFYKDDKSTEINRNEIESISFESRNNLNIIIKTKSGEKIPYMPSGFGLKAIRELETWWGQPIKGKKANLSYEHIFRYAEMFDKIKKIFIRSND